MMYSNPIDWNGFKIFDKLASDRFIIESGMNYTPFRLAFNFSQAWDAITFSIAPISIRFKGTGMMPFKANLSKQDALDYCEKHFNVPGAMPLGIYEATEHYDQYRLFNGEIWLKPDGTMNAHYCYGTKKMRDALASPEAKHIINGDWDNKELRWAIDYLCKFGVVGPVVELTAFSQPVGMWSDRIVVWEVRCF